MPNKDRSNDDGFSDRGAQHSCFDVCGMLGLELDPVWTLIAATGLISAGLGLLSLSRHASAVVLYGGGIGIAWVARGTVPLALFGERDYAVRMGRLAFPSLIAQALAPSRSPARSGPADNGGGQLADGAFLGLT